MSEQKESFSQVYNQFTSCMKSVLETQIDRFQTNKIYVENDHKKFCVQERNNLTTFLLNNKS